DNAHIPYGDKTNEEVIALTRRSVKFLLNKNVKLIIFACNTATAAAMDVIQDEIKPQIIGVIQSGSLAAARTTKNKKVAVVATNVTVASHAYKKEIRFRDPNIQVTELAAPKLVPLVENGA
ncbi:MAG TPA: glutamate racemase, partial [Lactobacillus acetotolerans]|nr:glutamate racemase [Lactobacillus acetotolerans]